MPEEAFIFFRLGLPVSRRARRPEDAFAGQGAVFFGGVRERRAGAFLAGAVGALALPPVDFAPAMLAPMCAAVWLIDGATADAQGARGSWRAARSAAGLGWLLGFGYFLAGLWWLGVAFLVEADRFAWALPLATLGLPAALAVFTGAGFALASLLWSRGPWRVFALAFGLGASEWLRGHLLTGFPWNGFGMALAGPLVLAQASAIFGLYGLNVLAVAIFAAPATLASPSARRLLNPALVAALAALAAMGLFGGRRLRQPTEFVEEARLRIVQPNVPQDEKFKPENGAPILRRYLALSTGAGAEEATHVLWPESAFPFVLSREPEALRWIARALGEKVLLTGAARAQKDGGRGGAKMFNSIEVVRDGAIVAHYDKIHLVPFGEYLPLAPILAPFGVEHLAPGTWDRGEGPRRLAAPGLPPVTPLVCYEAIFPEDAAFEGAEEERRPEALLNVTNDGWFGRTSGPYQHLAQARLRAIEQGLPLARAANTGVSAIVDPFGRILQSLPLAVEGVIDGRLPKALPATPFARRPLLWPALLWVAAALAAAVGRFGGRATCPSEKHDKTSG